MSTVYGDGSGSESGERATVVACFFNSAKNWDEFDRRWRALLERFQVPYLHMREFAHSVGPFTKWKGEEHLRREFLQEALNIIETTGCISFATLVDSDAFVDFERRHGQTRSINGAYVFAARVCLSKISGWCQHGRLRKPVEYIFEDGDANQNVLRAIMRQDGEPEPIFRPKISVDPQRSIVPLQAADLLAYELLKGHRDFNTGRLRHPLKELERMNHHWGIYDETNIDTLFAVNRAVNELVNVLEVIVKERAAIQKGKTTSD
jgi:hypothetical protein